MDNTQHSCFGRPNPFLIPLVIQKVFNDLSLRDLKNCRRVCQLWKICSLSEFRKKRVIKILTTYQMESYIRLMKEVNPEEFPDTNYQLGHIKDPESEQQKRTEGARELRHLTQNRRSQDVLDLAYDIEINRLQEVLHDEIIPNTGANKLRSEFFALFGAHVKNLELLRNYECDSAEIRKILAQTPNLESFVCFAPCSYSEDGIVHTSEQQLPNLNLKTLGVTMKPGSSNPENGFQNLFLQSLLAMAPNLDRLTFGPRSSDYSERFALRLRLEELGNIIFGGGGLPNPISVSVFQSLLLTPTAPPMIHLKHINLTYRLKDAEVKELATKGFKLESFNFKFKADVKGTSVDGLLRSFRGTLVKASIDFCSSRASHSELSSYVFMTKCENLQDLTLTGYKGSFRILDNFPGLKSLECFKVALEESVFPSELHHQNLQELKLSCATLKSVSVTRRIVSSFPNLRTFEFIKGSNECMRAIYWGLPYLEKLSVFEAGCTDEGICGVPQNIYKDIINYKSLTLGYVDPGRIRADLSIASLPSLKSLRLEGDNITDVSIILGITSCKNLKSLSLKSSQITDESLINIATSRNMKTLTKLNVSRCFQITDAGKCFLSSELPKIGKSWGEFMTNERGKFKNSETNTDWNDYIPIIPDSDSDTDVDENGLLDIA